MVTGGAFGASKKVAQYSVTGEVTYLAELNNGRSYHACSKYEDDNGRTVRYQSIQNVYHNNNDSDPDGNGRGFFLWRNN